MQKQNNKLEFMVGIFLLAGILAVLMLALQVSGLSHITRNNSYEIKADFDNIGDLRVRAPVSISGVRIGEVEAIHLNAKTFKATVVLRIHSSQIFIPQDSSASIYTQGLLGSNYISLMPGFSDTNLHNGDKISLTHSAVILENLIGQLMFKLNPDKSK